MVLNHFSSVIAFLISHTQPLMQRKTGINQRDYCTIMIKPSMKHCQIKIKCIKLLRFKDFATLLNLRHPNPTEQKGVEISFCGLAQKNATKTIVMLSNQPTLCDASCEGLLKRNRCRIILLSCEIVYAIYLQGDILRPHVSMHKFT